MGKELVCALITETVKDRIKQIKEKAEASKTAHAKDVVKILEDEAKVLDKLAAAVKKEYDKHDFGELKKELDRLESLRDSKLAKAEALKKKHMAGEKSDKKKKIEEKLKPKMGAGAYVKDFEKSKAPQFKGKSKEKKQKMAIAAYLSAKGEKKK